MLVWGTVDVGSGMCLGQSHVRDECDACDQRSWWSV